MNRYFVITIFLGFLIFAPLSQAQDNSDQPSRRRFLQLLGGTGASIMINPGAVMAQGYSLPDSTVPDIWTEIYERNIHNGIMDTETFLNQMRGLEAAAGRSMKPLVRDLILRWEDFLLRGYSAAITQKTTESMADRSLRTLESDPKRYCQNVFSGS